MTLENCAICGCALQRKAGTYARPTIEGRSHATAHHYVPERFFGRSGNRKGTQTESVFDECPWGHEGKTVVFCYECHEELIHNPVLLPNDISGFAQLVRLRGFSEEQKPADRQLISGRVKLLHEVIFEGIKSLLERENNNA